MHNLEPLHQFAHFQTELAFKSSRTPTQLLTTQPQKKNKKKLCCSLTFPFFRRTISGDRQLTRCSRLPPALRPLPPRPPPPPARPSALAHSAGRRPASRRWPGGPRSCSRRDSPGLKLEKLEDFLRGAIFTWE